jgi:hypothetical protein
MTAQSKIIAVAVRDMTADELKDFFKGVFDRSYKAAYDVFIENHTPNDLVYDRVVINQFLRALSK